MPVAELSYKVQLSSAGDVRAFIEKFGAVESLVKRLDGQGYGEAYRTIRRSVGNLTPDGSYVANMQDGSAHCRIEVAYAPNNSVWPLLFNSANAHSGKLKISIWGHDGLFDKAGAACINEIGIPDSAAGSPDFAVVKHFLPEGVKAQRQLSLEGLLLGYRTLKTPAMA